MNTDQSAFRRLPSVEALLQASAAEIETFGRHRVTDELRLLLAAQRERIAAGADCESDLTALLGELRLRLQAGEKPSLVPVLNLTGTVLHTNLGRAALPATALDAVLAVSAGASNLEFDLASGARGERDGHIEGLICELTGAEAATVVNNNAAAVLLVLNTLALGREVPVSRGELVEIGGSFRIPEVMQRSGCTLVEVGATNRTHLKDYRNAIGEQTALLMKVHCSNYRIDGFTAEVSEAELAGLAHASELPLVIDLGSGNLVDFAALGLPPEPTVAAALQAGADVVTFSGDKLLGGPQAGIIAGGREWIDRIRRNPLKRALRLDKMTLAALSEVLKLYRNPEALHQQLPTLRHLLRSPDDIAAQAQRLLPSFADALPDFRVEVAAAHSQIGSGSLPVETIPSACLCIHPDSDQADINALAAAFRELPLPLVGRIQKNTLWFDLRCLEPQQEAACVEQLVQLTQ